jgi:hypothetical protein
VNTDAIDDLPLLEEGDVQWSSDSVILVGTVAGTELSIETTASASPPITAHMGGDMVT